MQLFYYFDIENFLHFAEQEYKPTTLNTPPSSPLHRFRETKFEESQIKSKTVMSWSSRKKRENIFCIVHFVRGKFVFYLNVQYIEYTFRIQWTLSLIRTLRGNLNLFELWRVRIMGSRSFLKYFGNRNSNYRPK